MAIATSLALIGVAAYVATNTSFSFLFVSDQYAAATTDAQRSLFLAEGQAIVAMGGYGLFLSSGFLLVAAAGLIVAVVMFTSGPFGKATACVGILANGLMLADYATLAVVPAGSVVSSILVGCAAILISIWWFLIARTLF
jgi:hypothetical protein